MPPSRRSSRREPARSTSTERHSRRVSSRPGRSAPFSSSGDRIGCSARSPLIRAEREVPADRAGERIDVSLLFGGKSEGVQGEPRYGAPRSPVTLLLCLPELESASLATPWSPGGSLTPCQHDMGRGGGRHMGA